MSVNVLVIFLCTGKRKRFVFLKSIVIRITYLSTQVKQSSYYQKNVLLDWVIYQMVQQSTMSVLLWMGQ